MQKLTETLLAAVLGAAALAAPTLSWADPATVCAPFKRDWARLGDRTPGIPSICVSYFSKSEPRRVTIVEPAKPRRAAAPAVRVASVSPGRSDAGEPDRGRGEAPADVPSNAAPPAAPQRAASSAPMWTPRPAAAPIAIAASAREQGLAAAPALMEAAGIPCQVTDARFLGAAQASKYYEVACQAALGFIIVDKGEGQAPLWAPCPDQARVDPATGKPNSAACFLPANLDDNAALAPYVARSGVPCDVANARGIGHNATSTFFEIACSDGRGFVMNTSSPPSLSQKVQMITCLAYGPTSSVACKLTTTASQLALIDQLAAESGKNCQITQKRYVLTSEQLDNYYEVACQDGQGYILQQRPDGSLGETYSCADAENIGGGCTLTNGRAAQAKAIARYTQLARAAGYDCDVSKYSPFDVNVPGRDVVELACSNRPDGAVAIFPVSASNGEAAVIYDCAHSEVAGYRCSFTTAAAAGTTLTADLRALGKTSCTVSAERFIGDTSDNHGFIEVACADGAPGYVIEYTSRPLSPTMATPCVAAKGVMGGCTLPQNQSRG